MLKIEDKLFHGIDLVNYGEYTGNISEFEVLEMILQSKRICTREQLQQEKSSIITYLNRYHGQASNEVCLAYHPNNYKYPVKTDKYEDAFYDFIFTNISIIINEQLLSDKYFKICGISREIRIEDSIYLPKYIEAIGYLDKINYVIQKIDYLIENKEYRRLKTIFFEPYFRDFYSNPNFVFEEYQNYDNIKKLLQKYDYNIPIIDPYTGKEFDSMKLNLEKSEQTLTKIKEIIHKKI